MRNFKNSISPNKARKGVGMRSQPDILPDTGH